MIWGREKPLQVLIVLDEDRQYRVPRHWVIEDWDTGKTLAAGFVMKTTAEGYARDHNMQVMNPTSPAEGD